MAKALTFVQDNNIASLEELDRLAAMASDDFTKIHSALKLTETRLEQVNLMIKNTGQYLGNKDIYKQYLNARNKAKFREEYRTEISLYEAARKYLQEQSDGKKLPSMKMLKEKKPISRLSKTGSMKNIPPQGTGIVRYRSLHRTFTVRWGYHRNLPPSKDSQHQMIPKRKSSPFRAAPPSLGRLYSQQS